MSNKYPIWIFCIILLITTIIIITSNRRNLIE
jgi:hypothetical protein